ncbi:MAG: Eco57I restriction-modification methylase domain-containing protein [Dehalobacter sp.]|nr:Eco57I restriction-modification methylase domain-containing protein [Dehalobacter sp.]
MNKTIIAPYRRLDLKIYGYHLPQLSTHQGSVKVGETNHEDVNTRIQQQTGTVGVQPSLLFTRNAVRSDGELFHDRDLHAYYRQRGIKRTLLNNQASEWYYFGDVNRAEEMTDDYISLDYDAVQVSEKETDYILRAEQAQAVASTLKYFQDPIHGSEFLWNAKPRFGKTLSTYDLVRKLRAKNVLIVTNRPAIANSWYDDFEKFIAWQEPGMKFVSETDALSSRQPMARQEFQKYARTHINETIFIRCVAFISLQDLKGARFAGGPYDKLEWVEGTKWDLLVIDEAHEGIDTLKTDRAFDKIKRDYTLHLSGTPFKAIATEKFQSEQIFNWSYLDEQAAKNSWEENGTDTNPYESLPTLNLFTYQMSKIIEQEVAKGITLDDDTNLDYAFDLNEFFSTKDNRTFVYEEDVIHFLDNLHTGKFPFAEKEHQQELNHTFWLLPRVAAAKAMEKLLNNHPFFKDYEIVLAAGDGISLIDDEDIENIEETAENATRNRRSYDRVKEAIANHPRTITLSVGQLTTGVTIPEWTAVLMLSNIKSPAQYFQASFRAQNPWEFQDEETGAWFRKENAYVFDFAPDRTLVLYDEFANNLTDESVRASESDRQVNIRELINFFPVIAEDDEGSLREISPEEVLTIPSHIKAVEVVKRGFMSNLLFANIGAIFSAPAELRAILDKISPEANKRLADKREIKVTDPMLNEKGEVEVPNEVVVNTTHGLFGQPIYKTDVEAALEKFADITNRDTAAEKISKELVGKLKDGFTRTAQELNLPKKTIDNNTKAVEKILTQKVEENLYQRDERLRKAKVEYEQKIEQNTSQSAREKIEELYKAEVTSINEVLQTEIQKSAAEATQKVVGKHLEQKEEDKKKTTEDDVRDHLRGFARTIPAFLMAYGSSDTTLATYDQNIDPATFIELTSITLDEFGKLRDGFDYIGKDGQQKSVPSLFNESVFNTSVKEFFKIKEKLADYLHGGNEEDIFDYIPPQRTNQIFTPRRVVKMMVDLLEEQDPQIFKNKETTFIDLYAKSGLYLTEIAKRLFIGLQEEIPNEDERIRWILECQLFGCAPSNIIYNMVKNYVYAGFPEIEDSNLLELDLTEAAKDGKVKQVLAERYGKEMKFDVIIGNPPYQESDGGAQASATPLYNEFIRESKNLNPRYLSMIIPARWYSGGKGLNQFRNDMLADNHIRILHDFIDASDCFTGVEIKGGVCYFLRDREAKGDCKVFTHIGGKVVSVAERPLLETGADIFIRHNEAIQILHKVAKLQEISFSTIVRPAMTFGFRTYYKNFSSKSKMNQFVKVYGNRSQGYVERDKVKRGIDWIDRWKVIVPEAIGIGDMRVDLLKPIISEPGSINTETYIMNGPYSSEDEAKNVCSYINTKFFHFLLGLKKNTQHTTQSVYTFIPLQDFTSSSDIDWTKSSPEIDRQLYKKYGLDNEEIAFIESMIRPME